MILVNEDDNFSRPTSHFGCGDEFMTPVLQITCGSEDDYESNSPSPVVKMRKKSFDPDPTGHVGRGKTSVTRVSRAIFRRSALEPMLIRRFSRVGHRLAEYVMSCGYLRDRQ